MNVMRALALPLALLLAACAAIHQQRAQGGPRPDQGVGRNLKVLPQNITHDELISTMRGFARSLGVRCDHCHVPNPPDAAEVFDFPSDEKKAKNDARIMIRMTRTINGGNYISKVASDAEPVTCWTCHRGQKEPEVMPVESAAEAPAGR
jgi:hypothetical protein